MTPWLTVIGKRAPPAPLLDVELTRMDDRITHVKAKARPHLPSMTMNLRCFTHITELHTRLRSTWPSSSVRCCVSLARLTLLPGLPVRQPCCVRSRPKSSVLALHDCCTSCFFLAGDAEA